MKYAGQVSSLPDIQQPMPQPYNLFTIYAREDARLLSELLSQLKPLEIGGRIKVWSDREIDPGVQWEQEIVRQLNAADIILILVSPAYYNSEYIHRVEIKRAVERHRRGEAKVLPIIARPCAFEDDPVVSSLQVLPTDGKAVTDIEHWHSQDKAWVDVVKGLKRTLHEVQEEEGRREQAARAAASAAERARADQAKREKDATERAEKVRRAQEQQTRRAEAKRQGEATGKLPGGAHKFWIGIAGAALLAIALFAWQPWKKQDTQQQNQPATTEKAPAHKPAPQTPDEDLTAFEVAERANTIAAWQQYLDKFPNSSRHAAAEKVLAELKKRVASQIKQAGTYIKLDEPGKARQLLRDALKIDPDNADAKAKLRSLQ